MSAPRILVFDSGMGGLTVAAKLREELPDAHFIYAADNAAFPYGAWQEEALIKRIVEVIGQLIKLVEPHIVVIACNTASTLAMAALRDKFTLPFVGTVPAIKPAAALTKTGVIAVLATPGTVSRDYTQTLIHTYAFHCTVLLHGATRLAEMAEQKLKGHPPDLEVLREQIAPVFRRREGKKTDVVVLGCTHYPLLLEEIKQVAPWEVTYIDPAPAIARRTAQVLETVAVEGESDSAIPPDTVILTAARSRAAESLGAYLNQGFANHYFAEMPV